MLWPLEQLSQQLLHHLVFGLEFRDRRIWFAALMNTLRIRIRNVEVDAAEFGTGFPGFEMSECDLLLLKNFQRVIEE
jgi:hypothetical protein